MVEPSAPPGTGAAGHSGHSLRVGDRDFTWRPGTVVTIGRAATCDVVVDDPAVSRTHLRVEAVADGTWRLADAGSSNGAFIAGQRIGGEPRRLSAGAPVRVHLGRSDGAPVDIAVLPDGTGLADSAGPGPSAKVPMVPVDLSHRHLGRSVGSYVPAAGVVTIGRGPSNDLDLSSDPLVSRHHAELKRQADGRWEVRDLGSHNGTFLNGARVTRSPLADEDILTIGNHVYVFRNGQLEQFSDADNTSLDVAGLTVTAEGGATLLADVSFSLPSRSMLAVVGPSGAGKSTLLRSLTGVLTPSGGQVHFAGRELHGNYGEFRSRIGSVPQDDLVHPELTPHSELEFAAALRLPPDTGAADRGARVDQVLGELGLTERAGLQISRLSGGQRKRVSVGAELLTQPALLFLDEPTSGLDPGNEKQLMSVLRRLADGGRVVVVVTHATQSLDVADRVLFLSRGGQVAYFGPPAEALSYFGQHGVTGGYADIFRALDEPGDVDWPSRFRNDPGYERYVADALRRAAAQRDGARPAPVQAMRTKKPSALVPATVQFRVLVRRQIAILAGDRRTLITLAAQAPIFGLIIAYLFAPGVLSTSSGPFAALLLWLLVVSATWLGASGTIREIVKELPIYRRERAVGLSGAAYVGSKFSVFGVIAAVQAIVLGFVGLSRQPLPPNDPPPHFIPQLRALMVKLHMVSHMRPYAVGSVLSSQRLEIAFALALTGIAGTALGLAVSAAVRKSDQAVFMLPLVLVLQMALSLPMLKLSNTSALLQQASKIASANWGMAAVASTTSLNQLMTPYLWDLKFGQREIGHLVNPAMRATPTTPSLLKALKTDPSWQHVAATWVNSASILLFLTAVLLGIAIVALRREDIGGPGNEPRAMKGLAAFRLGRQA